MPANLPPQYFEVEKKYREAKTLQEKLSYLQELLAIIPKHKGTEKLQGELKAKISKTREMIEKAKKRTGSGATWYQVDKQGAGQVVLLGLPNSGKSALLNALTNANALVADYPFTTTIPQVGMMEYEDIKIQIVDTPPLVDDAPPWLYSLYRFADIILIVLDAGNEDFLEHFEFIRIKLKERNIIFDNTEGKNSRAIVILNKTDLPKARENISVFCDFYKDYSIIPFSSLTKENYLLLKEEIFKKLEIIRVYTKKIGQPPERKEPIVLKVGTTVIDAAEHIHKDFKKNLQYTRLWNDRGFSGQRVEKNYILNDGDIVEFHL
uniref:TGS domain-containing protein n=1 Tax=candidate division WOR-3 bacterium TaxID=2052148 RepID=A0A7C4XA95_UNCW3